jgi:hypothetical protein
MEELYLPRSFDELISPSSKNVVQQLKDCRQGNKSILCMGSINTFKRVMLKQYVEQNQKVILNIKIKIAMVL